MEILPASLQQIKILSDGYCADTIIDGKAKITHHAGKAYVVTGTCSRGSNAFSWVEAYLAVPLDQYAGPAPPLPYSSHKTPGYEGMLVSIDGIPNVLHQKTRFLPAIHGQQLTIAYD